MITKQELINSFNSYNTRGKPVTVHTSLKAIGEIEGGAMTLLDALIECFTRDGGLLVVPTHTWDTRVLDLRKSESCIGVLPCIAADRADGIRSLHPSHSVTVFGERIKAMEFVKNDAIVDTPTSPSGSYGKLYEQEGYILLIGVGQEKNTFIHCVEEMLSYSRYLPEKVSSVIIHKNGQAEERMLYWFDGSKIPDVSDNFFKFEKAIDYYGGIQYDTLGNAKTQLCSAKITKEVIEKIYKNARGKELLADTSPLDEKLYII